MNFLLLCLLTLYCLLPQCIGGHSLIIPYSRKYWRELNLAVGRQIAIAKILADLNLAIRYGIATCIYASMKINIHTGAF